MTATKMYAVEQPPTVNKPLQCAKTAYHSARAAGAVMTGNILKGGMHASRAAKSFGKVTENKTLERAGGIVSVGVGALKDPLGTIVDNLG